MAHRGASAHGRPLQDNDEGFQCTCCAYCCASASYRVCPNSSSEASSWPPASLSAEPAADAACPSSPPVPLPPESVCMAMHGRWCTWQAQASRHCEHAMTSPEQVHSRRTAKLFPGRVSITRLMLSLRCWNDPWEGLLFMVMPRPEQQGSLCWLATPDTASSMEMCAAKLLGAAKRPLKVRQAVLAT